MQQEKNETKRTDLYRVDPRNILLQEGLNIRKIENDSDDIEHLMQSILENGVKRPLLLKNNPNKASDGKDYICVDGHRRLTAVLNLIEKGEDIAYVKAELVAKISDEDTILSMFLLNDGKPLSHLEKAEGVKRLHEVYGYSLSDISKKLSESNATISNLYTLYNMPISVKKKIESNLISSTLALEIARRCENETEFVQKIEELLEGEGEAIEVEKKGKKKRAKVTAKHAKKILGSKNVVKVLNKVSDRIKEIESPRKKFFLDLVELLNKKPAEDEVISWFENWQENN